jgi:CheY-like chemotaxis protein
MNSEQNVPEVQMHQGPPQGADGAGEHNGHHGQAQGDDGGEGHTSSSATSGMGHSKSSRRRRRKRKGKGSEAAGQQHEGGGDAGVIASVHAGGNGANGSEAQPHGQVRAANVGQQQSNQQSNGNAPGGTKRWEKKFRDRDRSRGQENPGNQASSNGGSNGAYRDKDTHQPGNNASGKRKGGGFSNGGGKQRGAARGFVGPMDHSYRAVNGNFLETPPSTIEPYGNFGGAGRGRSGYQGDSQPIDYSQGRTIPVDPDAPTRILFFIEDLFFQAKINETARKLGVKIAFIKNDKDAVAALTDAEEEDRPGLIVFDLNNANAKPLTLIPKLKTKLKKSTSIIGFLSHLQGDLKAKAVEAGCDTVMPRAAFSQNLPNLLRRYGIEEVEDNANYNQ